MVVRLLGKVIEWFRVEGWVASMAKNLLSFGPCWSVSVSDGPVVRMQPGAPGKGTRPTNGATQLPT